MTQMGNHKKWDWRSHWTVDLENSTASRQDGWVFIFEFMGNTPRIGGAVARGSVDADAQEIEHVMQEAADIYAEALNARH